MKKEVKAFRKNNLVEQQLLLARKEQEKGEE